jgi:hypothetical protein
MTKQDDATQDPKTTKENEVVARLKRAREDAATHQYRMGYEEGEAWAREVATYEEMEALDKLVRRFKKPVPNPNKLTNPIAFKLYNLIVHTTTRPHSGDVWSLWDLALTAPRDCLLGGDEGFARGFVDGALEFWAEHKDQIRS